MTAMTAATLDTLSGGRFRLGLGVSRPPGQRGLARRARSPSRWAAPASTSTSCGWPCGANRCVCRDALHAAAARRAGQGAQADHPPAAARPPDLPRGGGPEEPRAGRGDRRRLAGDLLQPGALGRPRRVGGDRRRRAGRGTDEEPLAGFDIAPSVPVCISDDVEAAAAADPPVRRPLHRRHGLAGAELLQPAGLPDGVRGGRGAGPGPLPGQGGTAMRRRPCPSSSSTRPRSSARGSGSATGSQRYADAGVGTLSVAPFAATLAGAAACRAHHGRAHGELACRCRPQTRPPQRKPPARPTPDATKPEKDLL